MSDDLNQAATDAYKRASATRYLGDGAYAAFDGWQIKIWTSNGDDVDQIIYLDDSVQENLMQMLKEIEEANRLCKLANRLEAGEHRA